MEYSIINENYRDFDVFEINKLKPRAYAIPFGSLKKLKATDCLTERYKSDKVRVLSGEWDFKYYEKQSIVPVHFHTDRVQFKKVNVPSTWQRTGYEEPCYLNSRYEFKLMPPELPEDVPVGVYRKFFDIDNLNKNYVISFLGVVSCLDLYLNGEFVGYSEGAHNSAEFDITGLIKKGENELVAVVHKWSTGTYLECQDMFRENGIFRDVLLYEYDKIYINDYEYHTEFAGGSSYNLSLCIKTLGDYKNAQVKFELFDGKKCIISDERPAFEDVDFEYSSLSVNEWSAEIPNVYEAYITLLKDGEVLSVTRNYIGFRHIDIVGEVFRFNKAPIKFKGVNHHDTNPKNGYVMTADEIKTDLTLMKQLNVNAIRTSHYPPDPMLLLLADIMGFYVVDEADIETHGTGSIGPDSIYKPNLISHDTKWANRYVDRVCRMYYRDRNHPCITMWSLGNEAGGFKNQDICYMFLNGICPEIPVHYEGVIRTKRVGYDVNSEMYTSIPNLIKTGEHKRGKKYFGKPLFMCEYCHAMGVGPGCLEDYWQAFYKYENLMGGCIWEWADHAVWHDLSDKDCKYKYEYTYGGDHGEKMHDGNFCVDGLIYPDRKLHTGALEMKAVYRPVRCEKLRDNLYKFINTDYFRTTDYMTIKWAVMKNGVEIKEGVINKPILPNNCIYENIEIGNNDNADYYLNIYYISKDGFEIAAEQIFISAAKAEAPRKQDGKVTVLESNESVGISYDDGKIVFSKLTGEMLSYTAKGTELINSSPADGYRGFLPNIFRAPIDNDSHGNSTKWHAKLLEEATPEFDGLFVKKSSDSVQVTVDYKITAEKKAMYHSSIIFNVNADGSLDVMPLLTRNRHSDRDIPRFGVTVELPESFDNAEYYGRGPEENACDFNKHSLVGIYKSKVADMHEDYIMPQDNGNHGGTRYLKLTDKNGKGVEIKGCDRFSFSVHNYTQKTLVNAKHREDVKDENTVFLSIDGFYRGVGTNSCGPDTLEKYRFPFDYEIKYKFKVKPIV